MNEIELNVGLIKLNLYLLIDSCSFLISMYHQIKYNLPGRFLKVSLHCLQLTWPPKWDGRYFNRLIHCLQRYS